jgi:hypothetical protein
MNNACGGIFSPSDKLTPFRPRQKTSWFMAYLLGKRKTPDRLVRGISLPIFLGVRRMPFAIKGRSHVTAVLATAETWVAALLVFLSNIGAEGNVERA